MKILGKIIFCFYICISSTAFAQTFNATVNRTDVPQGETFLLTLETDDDKNKATPDLSVLEKDFTVYSVGNAFKSTYINGQASHSRQWQIVLMPKNSGQIIVPSITFGNLSSQPITLNVSSNSVETPSSNVQSDNAPKFAIKAEVDNQNPYVQQQINYTLNIYDSGGLYGEAPVFVDNGSNDWIIKTLGEPVINSKIINGRQLREIQFKYAMFPQKSGNLKTPDVEFNGYYLTKSKQGLDVFDDVFNSGFFNMGFSDIFATRNPVVLKPENIMINVQPVPAINGGYWWLPASKVVLSSEWDVKNPEFRVGEAISRHIYIKAAGVIENQIPDIRFASIAGVKQYPEKPIAMSSQNNNEIISVKKFTNVLIPEQSGKITIPEISIDWYNIHTGQLEKAILPAQTVEVLPSLQASVSEDAVSIADNAVENVQASSSIPLSPSSSENKYTILWVIVAFVLGLFLSYLFFGRNNTQTPSRAKDYIANIKKATAVEDLKSVRDNLILWARLTYNDDAINNIDDIIKYGVNAEFTKQLDEFGKALYSKNKIRFDYKKFLQTLLLEQKQQSKRHKYCAPLPDLYK